MKRRQAIYLVIPAILFLLAFLFYPTLYAIKLAASPTRAEASFPTLSNFKALVGGPFFWPAVRNNLILPLFSVAIELLAGLGLALFLTSKFKGRTVLRTVAIMPFAIPEIVFLTAMRFVFDEHGYLNGFLAGAGLETIAWLRPESWLTLGVVALADAWHVTPIVFLILLAGLEAIPESYYEAAEIDGAGGWRKLTYVTLPLLLPALSVALVLRSIDALRIFATPLVLTGMEGAPVLSTLAYHYWADYSNQWVASAAATLLAVLVLSFSYLYLKVWRKSQEVEL